MKPKDIFGIIVRACGLWLARMGLLYFYDCWYWFHTQGTNAQPARGVRPDSATIYIMFGIPYSVAALYFLRGAPHLIAFCYPDAHTHTQEADEDKRET
jgi:hypothetical protein